jgi:hypothetical protein
MFDLHRHAFVLYAFAASAFSIVLAVAVTRHAPPPVAAAPAIDPCTLPGGIELGPLSDRDRSYVARHAVLCNDLEHGRIDRSAYANGMKQLDAVPPPPIVPPEPVYATSVRGFSTQYTADSWAATRALGAPDVYPAGGDNANAWASRDADAPTEFLEVGFDEPHRLRALDIFETYNPGAISHVEVITADGAHRAVYDAKARPMGVPSYKRDIAFACTDQPVVAVKVTLDSGAVPGWNEIDAIGGMPCD